MHTEEIQNLLARKFEEEGFEDCFLVSIELQQKNIRIFIDADSGVNFDKCQKISRYLETFFDKFSWFGDDYVLEVSSPGLDRPLIFPRQFKKNKGRMIQLKLLDGSELSGTLVEADEEKISLSREEIRKEGKKKIKETIETQLPYITIKEAKIVIKI